MKNKEVLLRTALARNFYELYFQKKNNVTNIAEHQLVLQSRGISTGLCSVERGQ